jgi:glyoxylase-like metal-dependent hydrolase (beta-lactamase superfamily II)
VLRPRSIAHGIEAFAVRTETLPPATHTNCYALGVRELLLVEPAAASDGEVRAFVEWVQGLRAQGRRPVALVATHHHDDHAGGAAALCEALALPLWAHEQTASRLSGVTVSRHLRDGDVIALGDGAEAAWHVLHTPGHAPGHLCLHSPAERTLVLGDMVASEGTILVAPGDGDMRVYLEQLERLAALEARLGLPGHGEPVEWPSALLRATRAHRLMREARAASAVLRAGPRGALLDELLEVVYDDTSMTLWPIARLSLRAHLDKLVEEGRVRAAPGDRYCPGEIGPG